MIKEIKINNLTNKVIMKKEDRFLGVKGENKYETLKFVFEDIFLNGEGILEIQKPNSQKEYIILEKEEDCYLLEVKNSLLNFEGEIIMQLVIRMADNKVFKSVEFTMEVLKAIEATTEIPDEYETWDSSLANKILEIDSKLEEITDLQEDLENKVATDYFKGEKGDKGDTGNTGAKGDPFTYEDFTEEQLASLKGQKGEPGTNGTNGLDGFSPIATVQATQNGANISITDKNGTTTVGIRNGIDGQNGQDGRDGVDGKDGTNGSNGLDGKSAYQIWIDEGNSGTEQDFLDSLKGEDADTQEIESELSYLREENTRLKNDLNAIALSVSATGENNTLENTAEARFKKFEIQGNSKQEVGTVIENETVIGTMPSIEYPSEIKNVTGDVKVVVRNIDNSKSQSFIFPLGNEKLMLGDYLADDGIHHVRGQVVYDGDETIFTNTNSGNIYAYILPTTNKARNTTVLSNYFSQISTYNGGVGIFSISNINVCIENISTVSEFKNWLSTHNLLVEYGLEEEVVVPYTAEQQAVYNQIKNTIKSYSVETNIYSTNEVSPVFDVVAYKDISSVIESLDNRITLLE